MDPKTLREKLNRLPETTDRLVLEPHDGRWQAVIFKSDRNPVRTLAPTAAEALELMLEAQVP